MLILYMQYKHFWGWGVQNLGKPAYIRLARSLAITPIELYFVLHFVLYIVLHCSVLYPCPSSAPEATANCSILTVAKVLKTGGRADRVQSSNKPGTRVGDTQNPVPLAWLGG